MNRLTNDMNDWQRHGMTLNGTIAIDCLQFATELRGNVHAVLYDMNSKLISRMTNRNSYFPYSLFTVAENWSIVVNHNFINICDCVIAEWV